MSTTELATRPGLADKVAYAKTLADSGLLPEAYRRQPANVLYAVEYGEMLGLAPMAAITGIHVIKGKPTASAALISALVRRAGHRLRITGDDMKAVAEIVRSDDPEWVFRSEWTLDRARTAGLLGKDTWTNYPAAMLKARAITEVARDACEEALCGMHYTPEEMGAVVGEDGEPIATVEPLTAPVDDVAQLVEDATTTAELSALWSRTQNPALRDRMIARAAELELNESATADDVVDAEIVEVEEVPDANTE